MPIGKAPELTEDKRNLQSADKQELLNFYQDASLFREFVFVHNLVG